jgi:ATP-binding cassette subfamily F protein 3
MLRVSGVTLRRGPDVLFSEASMNVYPGQKVGLVGPNGSGKTSLLALIRGEIHADAGEVAMPPRWVLSHVAQETPTLEQGALEFVIDGDVEFRAVERAIAEAEASHADGHSIAALHARYEEIGGYQARTRAQTLMGGLGFRQADEARPVSTFSGGWRMRLNLARALMCRADLYLLDEPTNHLDLDAVLWLEDWLAQLPAAVILVTHDREFLDAIARQVVHVNGVRLDSYAGNYSAFERQRAERMALQQAVHEKQQRTIAHLEAFITRFRAKATKARQAQSRMRALERLERIAPAHVDSPFSFEFRRAPEKPRQLFRLEKAAIGYGADPVLRDVEWSLVPGDAVGLLGPNGAGKSTLLKAIVGDLPLMQGELHVGQGLRIGYFAQHQVEQLRLDESALRHLGRIAPGEREQTLRDFLGGFDFRGDTVFRPVATFSGGEKARLALALVVWQRPNLLLLDEPTNHLDIEMREALVEALVDFEGGLVVVAHDRYLLESATDQWLLVADGRVIAFDGDLDDYKRWSRERQIGGGTPEVGATSLSRREERRVEAQARQKESRAKKPYEKRLAEIEAELSTLTRESQQAEAWLASSEAYEPAQRERLQETLKRRADTAARIGALEDNWLWTHAQMEREVNRARE